jgi:hypothetical protein
MDLGGKRFVRRDPSTGARSAEGNGHAPAHDDRSDDVRPPGLGCATDPTGRTTIKLPECQFPVGGTYPLPTHCRYGGAGIPVPGTGQ